MTDYAGVKKWRAQNPGCRQREYHLRKAKHPDRLKAQNKAAKARYRASKLVEVRAMEAASARRRRRANPEAQKARYAKWRARKEERLTNLAGRERPIICDICKDCESPIVFDHCHAGGYFRGWICDRCNKVLGLVRDSAHLLVAMAAYLEKDNGRFIDRASQKAA